MGARQEIRYCDYCEQKVVCLKIPLSKIDNELRAWNDIPLIPIGNGNEPTRWVCNACWEKHIAFQVEFARERKAAEAARYIAEALKAEEERQELERRKKTEAVVLNLVGLVGIVLLACVCLMFRDCSRALRL